MPVTVPYSRPARRKPPAVLIKAWTFVKRRKVYVAVVAWGVLVGILAFVSPSVTVREQTTVADSLEQLDQAMGDAVAVLSGGDYGYYLSPLVSSGDCDITPLRSGEQYDRKVTVHAQDPAAAVAELADALAGPYRLELVSGPDSPTRYLGRIPGYVELSLTVLPDDRIEWKADTGCRQPGDQVASLSPSFETPQEVSRTLADLGIEAGEYALGTAQCGDMGGRTGQARSVVATAELPDGVSDVSVLADGVPDRARVLVSGERLLVYRIGDSVTSVAMSDEDVVAATTVDCQ